MEKTKFYRYSWVEYATLDYDGDYVSSPIPNPKLVCNEFYLIKETEKGYWISVFPNDGLKYAKWISKTSKKRYAHPTKEEALNGFIKRTKSRIRILKHTLIRCEIALNKANNQINKNK